MSRSTAVKYLTVNEYAEMHKMAPYSIRRMCQDGRIKAKKLGTCWRIPVEDQQQSEPEESLPDISGAVLKWLDCIDQATRVLRMEIKEARRGNEG